MSQQDRDIWNRRYAEDSYRKSNPLNLVESWLPKLTPGRALDIACGTGRNAIMLAQAGFRVDAIDISARGLELAGDHSQGLDINWIEHDLDEAYAFDSDYDLIVVMWYVNLPLITRLCDCLATAGHLLCEEHLRCDTEVAGPGNANYRVAPGELRQALASLEIIYYRESIGRNAADEQIASAAVVARKP